MFYQYCRLPIGLAGAKSVQLDITVLDPVPDCFYLFLLDLTTTLGLTILGIPGL